MEAYPGEDLHQMVQRTPQGKTDEDRELEPGPQRWSQVGGPAGAALAEEARTVQQEGQNTRPEDGKQPAGVGFHHQEGAHKAG